MRPSRQRGFSKRGKDLNRLIGELGVDLRLRQPAREKLLTARTSFPSRTSDGFE